MIFAFWVLGLGPISSTVAKNEVLQQACTAAVWGRPENALICKDYKALWAMTLVATYVFLNPFFSMAHAETCNSNNSN